MSGNKTAPAARVLHEIRVTETARIPLPCPCTARIHPAEAPQGHAAHAHGAHAQSGIARTSGALDCAGVSPQGASRWPRRRHGGPAVRGKGCRRRPRPLGRLLLGPSQLATRLRVRLHPARRLADPAPPLPRPLPLSRRRAAHGELRAPRRPVTGRGRRVRPLRAPRQARAAARPVRGDVVARRSRRRWRRGVQLHRSHAPGPSAQAAPSPPPFVRIWARLGLVARHGAAPNKLRLRAAGGGHSPWTTGC